MSVFNRIAGTEEPKIPVWPVMGAVMRVLDGKWTFALLVQRFDLTEPEQAKVQIYLGAIGQLVQDTVAEYLRVGFSLPYATRAARVDIDGLLRYLCLQAEDQEITEAEFDAALGIV